jgi:two-component system, LytTR family, sensor kinase
MERSKSRFVYMIIGGIAISLLLHAIVPFPENNHYKIYDFLIAIFITILAWEGNLRIDHWMNKRFPWVLHPGKRILVHFPVSMVFSIFAIYVPMILFDALVCNMNGIESKKTFMATTIVIGILVSVIILTIEISTQFFKHWKKSMLEAEQYKTESVQAQLQNLKNQINPHFLFNNMSVLSSLVYSDQDKAVDFINQLSKVYRYLLDNRNNELVTLENELAFIHSYIYLIQIRFDKNIVFKLDIKDEKRFLLVPPMSIQMLIENAIKHNEISEELPLTVSVLITENAVIVKNNLQLRTNQEVSSKSGLQNIKDRYKYYSNQQVMVVQDAVSFSVTLPLLNSK